MNCIKLIVAASARLRARVVYSYDTLCMTVALRCRYVYVISLFSMTDNISAIAGGMMLAASYSLTYEG